MLPVKADISFQYVCPKCGDTYWLSSNEVKTPGFKVVCHCKLVLRIQPLENIKVSYKQRKNRVATPNGKPSLSAHILEAEKILRGIGYMNSTMRADLMKSTCNTAADLVKEYLKDK